MDFKQVREEIRKAVWDVWNPTGFPLSVDNIEFTAPEIITNDDAYARILIRQGVNSITGMGGGIGNRRFTQTGDLLIRVYIPINVGTQKMDDHHMLFKNRFNGSKVIFGEHTINFGSTEYYEEGSDEEGKWYRATTQCPFKYNYRA